MADPIHQFEIQKIAVLGHIGGQEIAFTNSALFMAITVVGIWALLMAGSSAKSLVPGRMQSMAEIFYEFIGSTLRQSAGHGSERFMPLIFSLFMFVLVLNMLGMIPYAFAVTSHIIVTFALSNFNADDLDDYIGAHVTVWVRTPWRAAATTPLPDGQPGHSLRLERGDDTVTLVGTRLQNPAFLAADRWGAGLDSLRAVADRTYGPLVVMGDLNATPSAVAFRGFARRSGLTSSVRATLSQSRRTLATPKAVLISIGQIEQMKITKMPDAAESLIV